jgi:D-galactose 1-dehydrogenase
MTTTANDIGIGLVGIGKIARDQHIPSIERTAGLRPAAAASRHATLEGVENYRTIEEMLAGAGDVDAVSLCTPPQVRHAMARAALEAGKHVLLEKPPGVTLSEIENLKTLAAEKKLTLFATWHSRFAAAVEPARSWLAQRNIRSVHVEWKEDVTHWHPGQKWIWEAGGLGVFDPGINALSILTRIMPHAIFLTGSELSFPSNCETPIAADLVFADHRRTDIRAEFDWRQKGPQTWDITVETDSGTLKLSRGGHVMHIDGEEMLNDANSEYDGIYRRFAELIAAGESDVDVAPLRHVADAFMLGRRREVEAFSE